MPTETQAGHFFDFLGAGFWSINISVDLVPFKCRGNYEQMRWRCHRSWSCQTERFSDLSRQ